ncbi:HlyD family efflux transporter periplasmic adaptor subunit [uncultured Dokdonia sp.]|uniref:HlyD family secretion protein n=1 Tax=uncultured Dokdonia sp. TaxID=575653 RepID=UPI002613AEA2|nr:HlyD family efflux transporter periplasmic adaptor subunit [uncultured Dokdonia sp.]
MSKKLEEIELRSEQVQDILSYVPHWMIRYGNVLFLVLIILFLALSFFIKYPDVISSEAIITTIQPPQKIYANTKGKLDTLLVVDNQQVSANTPLAIIENSADFKDVFYLKSIIDTVQFSKKSFEFPIDKIPILFLGDIDTQYAQFENSYQQYLLNKQLRPFTSEAIANSTSISELKFRLQTLRSQKKISQSELDLRIKEHSRNKSLYEKGVISTHEYEVSESSLLQSKNTFVNNDASISQTLEAISNAQKSARSTKINSTKEDITLLKNVLHSFNQLKLAIKNWEMRYVMRSDINGIVSTLNIWNENQNVSQGDRVFTIIPKEEGAYIAKLKALAQNAGKIKTGQHVQLKLQDYPDNEYGILEGTISKISAVTDEEGFYLLDVSLPTTLITSYNKEILFRQEMLANGKIITEDLRLIERFFYQVKGIFEN